MKKRLLSLFLALCLLAALLPAAVLAEDDVIDVDQAKLDKYLGEASLISGSDSAFFTRIHFPQAATVWWKLLKSRLRL